MVDEQMLRERDVIVGLTSTACRLLGIAYRDGKFAPVDAALQGVKAAGEGLSTLRDMAGSDCGAEYTIIALRQIAVWLLTQDLASAKAAFEQRYKTTDEEFCASMREAMVQLGYIT